MITPALPHRYRPPRGIQAQRVDVDVSRRVRARRTRVLIGLPWVQASADRSADVQSCDERRAA